MENLKVLVGLLVERVEKVHDYVQVFFSGDTRLSIFNQYRFNGDRLDDCVGCKVISIDEDQNKIFINLENEFSLSVGLADEDYVGPEAMVLFVKGKLPIVWS